MNNTITEDYVSFLIAKLLREKGFDIRCSDYYDKNGEVYPVFPGIANNSVYLKYNAEYYHRPTHAIAIKWIRENFDIFIENKISGKFQFYCVVWANYNSERDIFLHEHVTKCYSLPEEATEAALRYCLENLI